MALLNTWSRRKRDAERAAAGTADVYRYDAPSERLREQIRQLIDRAAENVSRAIYRDTVKFMRLELGRPVLVDGFVQDFDDELGFFIIREKDVDEWLTAVETATRIINYHAKQGYHPNRSEDFITELNARMLEDSFGFQFSGGAIIQISSQFVHSEMIVPVLNLLNNQRFAGANSEFRQAHAEFRAGEYEDCIHDCCNALESVLKVIIAEKGWGFQPTDTAKKLLEVAFTNGLIPVHMQNSFAGLRSILESGVPTVRNKNAGHGTGAIPRSIPRYLAAFQLHQTAAAILLLTEAAQ